VVIHPDDLPRWRSKLDQIEATADLDEDVKQRWVEADELRPVRDAEARSLVAEFVTTRDFAAFRTGSDKWSRREGPYIAFSGFGQMRSRRMPRKRAAGSGPQAPPARPASLEVLAGQMRPLAS